MDHQPVKKKQAKSEQCSRRNNIELFNILNDIPQNNLEKVDRHLHDSGLEKRQSKDMEVRHRLPVSRYSRDSNKRVIIELK